jgi:hypothetical protein
MDKLERIRHGRGKLLKCKRCFSEQEVPKSWMERLSERMGNNPLMDRIRALRQSEAARRVSEGIQDVREKLENTDSEVIGRIQDMTQRVGEQNEAALTYQEIRLRHPSFDMPNFLHAIKQDVPIVIKVPCHSYLYTLHDMFPVYLILMHHVTSNRQIPSSDAWQHRAVTVCPDGLF